MTEEVKGKFCSENLNDIWGPVYWKFIHTLCATYEPSNENKKIFSNLLSNLADALPCCECKEDFQSKLSMFDFSDKMKLFDSSVLIHNFVNQKLGKNIYSIKDARLDYHHFLYKDYDDYNSDSISVSNVKDIHKTRLGTSDKKNLNHSQTDYSNRGLVITLTVLFIVVLVLSIYSYINYRHKYKSIYVHK